MKIRARSLAVVSLFQKSPPLFQILATRLQRVTASERQDAVRHEKSRVKIMLQSISKVFLPSFEKKKIASLNKFSKSS